MVEESEDDYVARMDALREQIANHPGRLAHQRWNSVRMVHSALKMNENFLVHLVDFDSPEGQERAFAMMGQEPEQRANLEQFWLALFLFLANYTSMNSTLVEHVRGLMANYRGTPFAQEEERRRRALGFAPVTQFVKDLRNTITHVTTPPMSFEMNLTANEAAYAAKMSSTALLNTGRFSSASKSYLAARQEVVIAETIAEYAKLREQYYQWLFSQFLELHGRDLQDHDRLVRQQHAFHGRFNGS
ncbi:hypothetical protein [Microbacterium sp. che218]|uniref:hypothetical protein n=1 Tax=Microbacterium sp. che218 TaxID=3140649 RepID=UPI003368EF51